MSVESELAKSVVDTVNSSPQYQKVRWAAIVFAILFILAACIGGYFAWRHYTEKPVTYESQVQAGTIQGVREAANDAHVPVSDSHAQYIAQEIKEAALRNSDAAVSTTGQEMLKVVEEQRQKSGADFAIVTDPKHPDEKPIVKPADPVVLNQYNIRAYPGHIWSGTYYANRATDISWQMRIGKSGTYVGLAVLCADGKATYGIRVTRTY